MTHLLRCRTHAGHARARNRLGGRRETKCFALDRLMRQKLLAIVGMSGCGKSSLVTAGMVPALEMGLAGDPARSWRIALGPPGA